MAYESNFFAAKLVGAAYDRLYDSTDFALRFSTFFSNGVIGDNQTIGTNLEVTPVTGTMKTSTGTGYLLINGYMLLVTAAEELTHDAADATNPRIDRVVAELDTGDDVRAITLKILKGTAAASPAAPAVVRAGTVYQLSLGQVEIPANVAAIPSDGVTDERSDSTVCGVARLKIASLTLTTLSDDTTPQLGGELDMNGHSIGGAEYDNGNSGTSKAIDWRLGNHQKVTMTGNCTFTFTAPTKAGALSLRFINDSTAGRTITLPTIKWAGGSANAPVWTKTANAIDMLNLYYDGSAYCGMASLAWA